MYDQMRGELGKRPAKAILPELSDDKRTSDYNSTTAA